MSHLLLQRLEKRLGKAFDLKINDNRSTMLSVKWEMGRAKVSLHRMFLEAPCNVMDELACYIGGRKKAPPPSIKAFIENNLNRLDYSCQLDLSKLSSQGNVYNLQDIYNKVNQHYFDNRLRLHITWFGKSGQKNRSRITFGLFHQQLKLIKIHRLLDCPSVPEYTISYVVYHEMLHHECPAYVDGRGLHHIHSKEFKQREAEFEHFDLARKWIRDNEPHFFMK